jgi:hypothetical protein
MSQGISAASRCSFSPYLTPHSNLAFCIWLAFCITPLRITAAHGSLSTCPGCWWKQPPALSLCSVQTFENTFGQEKVLFPRPCITLIPWSSAQISPPPKNLLCMVRLVSSFHDGDHHEGSVLNLSWHRTQSQFKFGNCRGGCWAPLPLKFTPRLKESHDLSS